MQAVVPTISTGDTLFAPLQAGGIIPKGSRVNVFQEIYWVFIILGTLVGVVVIGYMLYNAYKYRDRPGREEPDDIDRPELGEIPQGGGKGRKLFLSFAISAVIVISLVVWTYGTLLYVEQGAAAQPPSEEALNVTVVGFQFGWQFVYPDAEGTSNVSISGVEYTNVQTSGTLHVPEDRMVRIRVTSRDVMHNIGVPELRFKTDAIPGQWTETWFLAESTGTYEAQCFELCGAGHSFMSSNVDVMSSSEFQQWYNATGAGS